jgi:WD40 repeat protein
LRPTAHGYVLGTYDGDSPGFLAISPDGNRALSSGGARKVVFWDLNERSTSKLSPLRRAKRELGENDAEIASYWPDSRDKPARVAFVEPSKAIVTTGDGSLFLVDCSKPVTKGLPFASAHGAFVSRVLANANGTLAVTSSFDGTIRVWNLRSRESVAVLSAHPGAIEKISAGIERALLFSDDGVLKLISLNDGALIAAFEGDKRIYACDADPELKWIVACDQGGQMHFLHLEH